MDFCDKDPLAMEVNEESDEEHTITPLMPVVIEELHDYNAVQDMNVCLDEFQETQPIQVQNIQALSEEEENVQYIIDTDEPVEDEQQNEEVNLEEEHNEGENNEDENNVTGLRRSEPDIIDDNTFAEYLTSLNNEEEEAEEFEITKNFPSNQAKMPEKAPMTRRRRILPPALSGLMGEANLRFSKGETEMAAHLCYEIIRQCPNTPDPYQTLAMIYEHEQPEKSLQFSVIAAHLSPRDAEQWVRLAHLSLESGNIRQAITCYSRAISLSPKKISYYEMRAQLQEQLGDQRGMYRGLVRLINSLDSNESETIMKYAKMLAKHYIQEGNYEHALSAMANVFEKCTLLIEPSDVNVMVEVLIALKRFHRSLDILTQYSDIWIIYRTEPIPREEGAEENIKEERELEVIKYIDSCGIPDNVPVDLKAKCLVALIELNEIKIAEKLLPGFYQYENPEFSGDLFLDVAEALMSKKQFVTALDLLEPLVNSTAYSLAAVWLRYAECWLECGDISKAISSFEVVRRLSPGHMAARLELARLYEERRMFSEAINALYQEPELIEDIDACVLLKRTQLLHDTGNYAEFFQSASDLFSRHCLMVKDKSEITALTKATCYKVRIECLQRHRLSRGESLEDAYVLKFKENCSPPFEDEFRLFLLVCRVACRLKQYGLYQKFCFSALTSAVFECKNAYLMLLCLIASVYTNDTYHGFNIVRELVKADPKCHYWNLLNVIIQRAEDSRHNRFMMRLLTREDVFSHLHILHANNCLVAGTYKYALNDYISLFKTEPSALLAFLIAVTQLLIACQKFTSRKNQSVIQALAFLHKYAQVRGEGAEQEISYNMGRAFHQLGMIPAAVHYYKQVLNAPTPKLVKDHHDILDLKREAAFNLHLIYQRSDNPHFANMYLQNYITI